MQEDRKYQVVKNKIYDYDGSFSSRFYCGVACYGQLVSRSVGMLCCVLLRLLMKNERLRRD